MGFVEEEKAKKMANWVGDVMRSHDGVSDYDILQICLIYMELAKKLEPIYDKYHSSNDKPQTADFVSNDMAKAVMSGLFRMNFGAEEQ